ncbi:hydroxymethylbilane synthase [Oleiagrimonas sp.]|uniref:hydroxymethylbilane synthase n=1 Tax=Oleiagrimonas sp. TaxID=2010330 RepID=UPI002630467D|nr:hydroxymethylbilane synthase [Oleiagrimonas sp.]MDA3913128.1 hydroxymethylbilane synthase [Oleiagrimonas sp.]
MQTLRIATRKSALALWQAEHVAGLLRQTHPDVHVELVPMSTRGDQVLDQSLASIGGKGLFLKELEVAMLERRADIAVHSLKDVPAALEPGFTLGAILPRADAADAFVSRKFGNLSKLPQGARVGTSSLRRAAQLRALRPDCQVLDLRGNVNTRLAKLDDDQYEAIVLACAGLERLGMADRIRSRLHAPGWLPAPGQAAVAVEMREGDHHIARLLKPLEDMDTRIAVNAERSMNAALGGSCTVPVGAWCVVGEQGLTLMGLVGDVATGRLLRARAEGVPDAAAALGRTVARQLLDQGAAEFLAPHAGGSPP